MKKINLISILLTFLIPISGSFTSPAVAAHLPHAPVADAGPNQTVHTGTTVTLDGSKSIDSDGDTITYAWSFTSVPPGSTAQLAGATTVHPTFKTDKTGDYKVQLIVTDNESPALSSLASTVTISTTNSPPVADAGPDQAITVIGTLVQLDGSKSYDIDGDAITDQWSFISKPQGSTAQLSSPTAVKPTFVADVHGDYLVQLVVSDGDKTGTGSVTVSFSNVKPVANAGTSQSGMVGDVIALDGSGSSDANGDPLTYQWSLISVPIWSRATIANTAAVKTTFVPDLPGTYVAQLIVNDGFVYSVPSTIQIQAATNQTLAIQRLHDLVSLIGSLEGSNFKHANLKNTLINKLNAVIAKIDTGDPRQYKVALNLLTHTILRKTDGCAVSGAPHKQDWIIDCASQGLVYNDLLDIIAMIEKLF